MAPTTERAALALAAKLRNLLPQDRAAAMTSRHVAAFEENLVGTLRPDQIAELRAQLARGDGRELEPGPNGEAPDAHSVRSSAVLAFNAFGPWLGDEEHMMVDGIGGFDQPLEVEKKQPIQRGGTPPNFDVLLTGPSVVAGVESKLLETLGTHTARAWQDSYSRPQNLDLLSGGWRETLDAAMSGGYATKQLDAGQLLRHALGLRKQHPHRTTHLVYCYWEPTNGDEIPEVTAHRAEVADLALRVDSSEPFFHALSYAHLLDEWSRLSRPTWLRQHIGLLRERYEIRI
jgi:hypothetical protein